MESELFSTVNASAVQGGVQWPQVGQTPESLVHQQLGWSLTTTHTLQSSSWLPVGVQIHALCAMYAPTLCRRGAGMGSGLIGLEGHRSGCRSLLLHACIHTLLALRLLTHPESSLYVGCRLCWWCATSSGQSWSRAAHPLSRQHEPTPRAVSKALCTPHGTHAFLMRLHCTRCQNRCSSNLHSCACCRFWRPWCRH